MKTLLLKAALLMGIAMAPGTGTSGVGLANVPADAGIPEVSALGSTLPSREHEFSFARAAYSGVGARGASKVGTGATDPFSAWASSEACGAGFCAWATDYPKAERQFLTVLRRVTNMDAAPREHAVRLDDPLLREYPLVYAVEVGSMSLTEAEVTGLRDYLLAGGILVVDDFWGVREWQSFQAQMERVLPEYPIVDLPLEHPLFHSFYDIDEIVQVPNVGQGMAGGSTSEKGGVVPRVRGILDEQGRVLAVINWNTDLGDAWEWAENPKYPLKYSTYAYQIGVNIVMYAQSH